MQAKDSIKNIESAVKSFLKKETGFSIQDHDLDLIEKGIVSSLQMFKLIDFIEKKFKIQADILSLNPDNFNSLRNIAKQIIVWTSK